MKAHVPPAEDLEAAMAKCLRFYVTERERSGAKWNRIGESSYSLPEALDFASSRVLETSVWLLTPTGGIRYWRSDQPDLFNSTVLALEL